MEYKKLNSLGYFDFQERFGWLFYIFRIKARILGIDLKYIECAIWTEIITVSVLGINWIMFLKKCDNYDLFLLSFIFVTKILNVS